MKNKLALSVIASFVFGIITDYAYIKLGSGFAGHGCGEAIAPWYFIVILTALLLTPISSMILTYLITKSKATPLRCILLVSVPLALMLIPIFVSPC